MHTAQGCQFACAALGDPAGLTVVTSPRVCLQYSIARTSCYIVALSFCMRREDIEENSKKGKGEEEGRRKGSKEIRWIRIQRRTVHRHKPPLAKKPQCWCQGRYSNYSYFSCSHRWPKLSIKYSVFEVSTSEFIWLRLRRLDHECRSSRVRSEKANPL